MFVGYVNLESTLRAPILILDAARTPVNSDDLPTFRVYGPEGLVTAASGVAVKLDTGTITGASNATPIVITSVNHGLTTGTYVTVSGVLGNVEANQSTSVTVLDVDRFELDGSVGTAAYTSGGAWNVAGLYLYSVACTAANGFEAGTTYYVVMQARVAGVSTADTQTFIVT